MSSYSNLFGKGSDPKTEFPWDGVEEWVAPPPNRLTVIRGVTTQGLAKPGWEDYMGDAVRAVNYWVLTLKWVPAVAVMLALFIIGDSLVGYLNKPRENVWQTIDGSVVRVEVMTSLSAFGWRESDNVKDISLVSAVKNWAGRNEIEFSSRNSVPSVNLRTIRKNTTTLLMSQEYQIDLLGVAEIDKDKLIDEIAALPGVPPPKVFNHTMYFHPGQLNHAVAGRKVFINHAQYNFPTDFSFDEVQYINQTSLKNPDFGSVKYLAFPGNISKQQNKSNISKFDIGDIIRVALTRDGDLEFKTVEYEWEDGRHLQHSIPDWSHQWWDINLPGRANENTFDYKFALSKKQERLRDPTFSSSVRQSNFDLRLTMEYVLFPTERLFQPVDNKYSQSELSQGADIYTQARSLLEKWCSDHPEYAYRLEKDHQLNLDGFKFGEIPLTISVYWEDNDDSLVDELSETFSTIKGMPEPIVNVSELNPGTE